MPPNEKICPGKACTGTRSLHWSRVYVNRRNGKQLKEPFERISCAYCGYEEMLGSAIGRIPESGS